MDYACIVYSSARNTILKPLDAIHHAGIRYCTGAFRTSPIPSICCESGIPPLRLRRNQLLLSYTARVWANQKNINYTNFFYSRLRNKFNLHSSATRPAGIRSLALCHNLNITLSEVVPTNFCEISPWLIPKVTTRLDLTTVAKNEICPLLLKTKFLSILNEYTNFTHIYTDGSKTEFGVGSAFAVSNQAHHWKLSTDASVYTAELYAIMQALYYCSLHNQSLFTICTDSLSALHSILDPFTTEPIVQLILASIYNLYLNQKQIILYGHQLTSV